MWVAPIYQGESLLCIVGPEYDSSGTTRAFFQGSCANCLWNGKSAKCDYYLSRTQGWNSDDDVTILQAGGLLQALGSGRVLKDIPPKVEEIADDTVEKQSTASGTMRTPRKTTAPATETFSEADPSGSCEDDLLMFLTSATRPG
ncbi:uncharacterized protein NFIA_027320 [Aspergillus fischeri NRRL 181]|uniref:Uncharacterized protein n=1 Tax=Neosartorya fischeri (strain ATCC 1020 / DSM 3700 / CBS 544.65 / FGSC A1164 / JCM 1740 / NRRL 181 / WB 181) TaxID=331117 RepID=A1DCU8_NEOFI|nr:uncharacterized protein NFIA_027320 [Aspergillus fischeri NRRL 181]EAW19658.1 hypothetical protein NFIA_027320 [Aspergillus fischeri NRRL 181]KAG2021921.1 hypothetical protein GB937_004475 [Aspergillus fischeri]